MSGLPWEAVLFDLDGVLTDTAELHFRAWQWLADRLGIAFDHELNRQLEGIGRTASLGIILRHGGRSLPDFERARLAAEKNDRYLALIDSLGPEHLLPGAAEALERCRAAGLKIGLASASRNAPAVLGRLGIAQAFDHVVDAGRIAHGKPAPDIVLAGALALDTAPGRCLGIEDAAAGIAALKAAGMTALGVGDTAELREADLVRPSLEGFDPYEIASALSVAP